jgi:hypothetical protein
MSVTKGGIVDHDDDDDDITDEVSSEKVEHGTEDDDEVSAVHGVGEVSVGGGPGGLRNMVLLGGFIIGGFWVLVSMLTGPSPN